MNYKTNNLKIFIIAGEASGDNLGAKLIKSLKANHPHIEFYGIGGANMTNTGLQSLFPMQDLSIMGFVEILPRIPKIIFRIWQTIQYVKKIKPDLIITIDSPGFNFQIAKRVKSLGICLVHYVAPTVWAYKPERAKKIAKLYDYLLVILPFEKEYFEREGLKTFYIGHPVIEDYNSYNTNKLHSYSGNKSILILPGSRIAEIKTLLPIFLRSIEILKAKFAKIDLYIMTLENLKPTVHTMMKDYNGNFHVITSESEKQKTFPIIDAAIVKSGTASFEVAMAKIPMIVAYKVNRISAYILKRLLKIKYVNLINILSGKLVIPELLQDHCNSQEIADELHNLMDNIDKKNYQIENSYNALKSLGLEENIKPSNKAAKTILYKILRYR